MATEPRINHPIEQQGHNPLDNQGPNPLLAMLTNMGMNLGGTNFAPTPTTPVGALSQQNLLQSQGVGPNMQRLIPQGVNAISAEELERRLINSEDNSGYTQAQQAKSYSALGIPDTKHGATGFNTGGLNDPPPGFSQPKPVIPVSGIPSTLMGSPALFPPFGLVGTPTIIPPSTFHAPNSSLERSFASPPNNLPPRFPLSEGLQQNYSLPVGNKVADNLIHSSPFGLGLPIGGLQHMIGAPGGFSPAHSTSVEGPPANAPDAGISLWNFPSRPQTQADSISSQQTISSPTSSFLSSPFSFPLPLNDLLNITPSTASDLPTASTNRQSNAQVLPPWPPK